MYPLPCVGDTIIYRMRLSEQPCNPLRLWQGVVEKVWLDCYRVRLTDEGYEGMVELVVFYQIEEVTNGK